MHLKKKYGYQLESEIVSKFEEKAERVGINPSRFVQSCMKAYAEDAFTMLDGVPHFPQSVTRDAPLEPKKASRPHTVKEPPKEEPRPTQVGSKKPDGSTYDWFELDHVKKDIMEYPVFREIPIGVDNRKRLEWTTPCKPFKVDFKDLVEDYYMQGREAYTERTWNTGGMMEFLSRCAMKFFALTKQDLRYDEDHLAPAMIQLNMEHDHLVRIAYDEGYWTEEGKL